MGTCCWYDRLEMSGNCCDYRYYYDSIIDRCVVCPDPCLTCTGYHRTLCTSCHLGMLWDANEGCVYPPPPQRSTAWSGAPGYTNEIPHKFLEKNRWTNDKCEADKLAEWKNRKDFDYC